MRIDFHLGASPECLLSVGGRWDRELEDYVDDAQSRVVVTIHEGQLAAVQWFAKWLAVHAGRRNNPPAPTEDDDRLIVDPSEVFSALFAGGRRGGKTWVAAAICAAYAVAFPDAIVFAVSPSRGKDDSKPNEIRRYMARLLAPEWIARETEAGGWELINGSSIQLKSAYTGADPDAIKEGEVHLVWLNEGQKMNKRVYTVGRAAIADKSGLVLVTANPPVDAKDQQWVADFAADASMGRRASAYLEFDPRQNPYINRRALLSLRHEVDERTYAIEVLGQFRGPVDAVAYNWQRMYNELSVPSSSSKLRDVTEEFMREVEEGENITHVLGLDVQRFPYIGGPVYRFYDDISRHPTRDSVLAWIVGEVVLEGGDELDWCAELRKRGFRPECTLIICDATGEYQHSRRRDTDTPPPEWTGKGSFDLIRGAGFNRIVPPSRRMRRKNPEIVERVRSLTSMIENGAGRRRLFADRDLAPKTCAAIREWKTVHGKPSRSQDVAHLGDGVSYPLIRIFPRILRSDNPGAMDPVTARVDVPDARGEPEERPRQIHRRRRSGRDAW
jgi:hypothetical protein